MVRQHRVFFALSSTIWIVTILACGGGGSKKTSPQQQEVDSIKPDAKTTNPELPPEPTWTPSTKAVRQGDIQIQISKTVIGKVPLHSIIQKTTTSKDELLIVKLDLLNLSHTKKLDYHGWSGKNFTTDRDFATLKDNFGNSYKRISFGLGTYPIGAVERTEAIYPDKTISDVLVFEIPVDSVTHLDLELPAKNFGGEGMIRFRILMKSEVEDQAKAERAAQKEAERAAQNLVEERNAALELEKARLMAEEAKKMAETRQAQLEAEKLAAKLAAEKKAAEDIAEHRAAEELAKRKRVYPQLFAARKMLDTEIKAKEDKADPGDAVAQFLVIKKYREAQWLKICQNLSVTVAEAEAILKQGTKDNWDKAPLKM